ncbi:FG-GAP repeat domain-containing protein [Streptomyces sp. NPDC007872]|uniref:FG-GAP repeat domain-containing protein n=1 Tax=Streptomyces sp. NPDC007872 TaxID=3364782 RepID=UPI00367BAA90
MKHRISGRRLAAAVLTLSTVTAVTGTLVTAPAVAAVPAARTAPATGAEAADAATLPVDADVVSVGDTGYLTSRKDSDGKTVLEWRKADGSVEPVGAAAVAHDSASDFVVTSDGGTATVRDMRTPAAAPVTVDLVTEFAAGAKLVGVIGKDLFVQVPREGNYQDLWLYTPDGERTRKVKLSGQGSQVSFKVVASAGNEALVLVTTRYESGVTFRTQDSLARVDFVHGGSLRHERDTGKLVKDASGAITHDYTARVESRTEGNRIIVDRAGKLPKEILLDSFSQKAVIVGIVGDVLLYGVPGETAGASVSPLYAVDLFKADAQPYELLERFSGFAHAPDGAVHVRGVKDDADGLYRLFDGVQGSVPVVTEVASTGRNFAVTVLGSKVPTTVDLQQPGTRTRWEWTISRPAFAMVTLTHVATGKKVTLPGPDDRSVNPVMEWDGLIEGASAPNGAYTWNFVAVPGGIGSAARASGTFRVTRQANPHDFTDNGSTDLLARDSAGTLWRDDLFDGPVDGRYESAGRTAVGTGWNVYEHIEAVGNIGGAAHGDVVALDADGDLWSHLAKGDGTFAPRTKIGYGWGVYDKITGGSDLTGDGRPDLVATDTTGTAWLYKGTGDWAKPYTARTSLGGGWGVYNQITAVGNIAGATAGDLVARDTNGVLWLHLGKGDGTFAPRTRIGGGWNMFTQLVGAGDVDNDGRPDLIGYGPQGTYLYRATGSWETPFTRADTQLYDGPGEGSAYSHLA